MYSNIPIEAIMTAFEASYDGLHILDEFGNTLYINSACTRIEGISKAEALEKNIQQLIDEGVYSESVTLKVLETKEPVTIIQTVKNGNQVLATGTPIFKENGSIDKVIVNSRDITDLNNLRIELLAKETELQNLKLEQGRYSNIVANSAAMKKVMSIALTVSKVDSTVLLTGESGVGKDLIARFIHENSERSAGPFIKVDCSSIPETLIESELFGYVKGAFTGAEKTGKIGLLERAKGGTVFLDEIGEMPFSMQPKLMRAIQDREILPVGANETVKLDVRYISATNVNLLEQVNNKKFREDLYYRLNVVPLEIPPLRSRRADIPPLIMHLTQKINGRYGFQKKLSQEAYNMLLDYSWPGNVRQLENGIERLLVSTIDDIIDIENIPASLFIDAQDDSYEKKINDVGYRELLSRYDYNILKKAIAQEGSVSLAAKKLGINVTTVRRKIKKYEKE